MSPPLTADDARHIAEATPAGVLARVLAAVQAAALRGHRVCSLYGSPVGEWASLPALPAAALEVEQALHTRGFSVIWIQPEEALYQDRPGLVVRW